MSDDYMSFMSKRIIRLENAIFAIQSARMANRTDILDKYIAEAMAIANEYITFKLPSQTTDGPE